MEVSYIDYYRERHNVTIRDRKQPLLVSNPKPRDIRDGRTALIKLIPELCSITGRIFETLIVFLSGLIQFFFEFSNKGNVLIRNFSFFDKRKLEEITKLNPQVRCSNLRGFLDRIIGNAQATENLNNWRVALNPDMIRIQATRLRMVTICFGNGVS